MENRMSQPVMLVDTASPLNGIGRYVAGLFRLPTASSTLRHAKLDRAAGSIQVRPRYDDGTPVFARNVPGTRLPANLWNLLAGRVLPEGPLHLTTQNLSRIGSGRGQRMVTVHDLFYRTCPRNASDVVLGHFLYAGIQRCDLAVCISTETADDLQRVYRFPTDRIRLVPQHVDLSRFPADAPSPLPDDRPYVLHTSSEEPRKNFDVVLRAFARLRAMPGFKDFQLVKVGRAENARRRADHLALIEQLGIADAVRFFDRVEDPAYGALFRGAHCFFLPSSAEGFGLPLLEALGQGCPGVAGDILSLREIGGEEALYAHPRDAESMAERMAEIPMAGTEARQALALRCREQSVKFSSARFLGSMERIYSELRGA